MPLTSDQITDLVRTHIGNYMQGAIVQTQDRAVYAGWSEFWDMPKSREVPHKLDIWDIAMRDHNNTAQILYFDTVTPTRVPVVEQAQMDRHDSNTPILWDIKEVLFATSKQIVVDHVDVAMDAALRGCYTYWDNKPFRARLNASATMDIPGLPEIFPMLGVGVEDPVGGWNGQTIVYGDASTGTTYENIDASTVANSRWRGRVATIPETVTPQAIRTIAQNITKIRFQKLDRYKVTDLNGTKGTKPGASLFVNDADYFAMEALRNSGSNADAQIELEPDGAFTIRGAKVVRTEALNGLNATPMYLKVHRHVTAHTASKRWMTPTEVILDPNAPDNRVRHIQCSAQIKCTNRREGGACFHRVRAA